MQITLKVLNYLILINELFFKILMWKKYTMNRKQNNSKEIILTLLLDTKTKNLIVMFKTKLIRDVLVMVEKIYE